MTEPTELRPQSRVDAETVKLLREALKAAEEGTITGIFVIGMVHSGTYTHMCSDSMHGFVGRGMMVSAVIDEFANLVIDPKGPKIGQD